MSPILPHTKKPRTFKELRDLTGLDHEDLSAEIRRQRREGALREVPPDGVNDRAIRYVNAGVIVRKAAPVIVRACELVTLPPGKRRSHDPAAGLSKWRQGEIRREQICERLKRGPATSDELGDYVELDRRRMEHMIKMLVTAGRVKAVDRRGRFIVWALVQP